MKSEALSTTAAPAPAHAFPQGLCKGPFVQVSGQGPVDPATGEYLHPGDVKAQTLRTLQNVEAILTAGGASLDDVMMLRVYLASRDDFAAMNEAYADFVAARTSEGAPHPCRTTLVCTLPRAEMLVEIDAVAYVDLRVRAIGRGTRMSELDVVIRGAEVADGTGAPRFRADVGIADGRVSAVTASERLDGRRVIDASGLVCSPGFIDMHAHSELAVLTDHDHLAKLGQGCTLEVLGQDGLSYAPVTDETAGQMWDAIAAWNGRPDGVDLSWRSVGDYLDRIDRGTPTNIAYLIPHGTVRMLAMGWDDRPPTESELDQMRRAVADGMEQGAAGLSAGLSYTPGMYADTAELVALCEVVARYGGYFGPHQRSYGAGALEGYTEMIEIARSSGCALHLAHATMNYEVNAGRAPELLKLIDEGLDEGLDLGLDTYPYLPGMTMLAALLPSWSIEGGYGALAERIADPAARARIVHELHEVGTDGANGMPVPWDLMEISGTADPGLRHLVGSSVAEAARDAGRPAAEFYLDLLAADDFSTGCLMHVGNEENVRLIMKHRTHTGSTDGVLHGEKIHPRAWGSFARYLGHYSRELGLFSLEECVNHLTGRPAARLGLTDRGTVAPGTAADLVLFDPEAVAARATFAEPRLQAAGIPYVFVNGRLAMDDGRRTDALAGRSVRRRIRR